MSAIVSTVLSKIRALVPESASRWSTALITQMALHADMLVCDMCETTWDTKDITLLPNTLYYGLDNDTVSVGAVLHSTDGTNFTDYVLDAATLTDLDKSDVQWRARTGTRPTHFGLLGAPGYSNSRLLLWPKLAAVTTEAVRVVFLKSRIAVNTAFTTAEAPDWIINDVYVPLTLGLIYGATDADAADYYVSEAMSSMQRARARYTSKYQDGFSIEPAQWLSRLRGQLG